MAGHLTSTHEEQRKANADLWHTLCQAKCTWAHDRLYHAIEDKNIWSLAKTHNGQQVKTFLPLKDPDMGELADNPQCKADIFHHQFFPSKPQPVDMHQDTNPPTEPPWHWDPILADEITTMLWTTTNDTTPRPSGTGYWLLKWAHATWLEALTDIYNASIDSGVHLWKEATVVVLNKPNWPDYSLAKVYRPISLLECTGKLLKKIIAKQFNRDILIANLLSMTQFGSCPHHTAIDAIAVLTHHIQATHATNNVGTLLLFDISGFYNNLHPTRLTQVIRDKGFPPNVVDWVYSFLTDCIACFRIGVHTSDPFTISHSTPQGSPLSLILSAFYTSALLHHMMSWQHSDLSLYVNDGAIYTTSATERAAASKVAAKYKEVL